MKTDFIRPKDAPWWLSMLPYLLLIGDVDLFVVYDDASSWRRRR